MAKVKIYQFRMWDSHAGEIKISRRWATREFIKEWIGGGGIIEDSEAEVDESAVDKDGLTPHDFSPRPRVGFQNEPPK